MKLRRAIGTGSFALALAFIGWLSLGILEVVPLVMQLPGESAARTHAGVAVASLMVAAWGYWND